MIPLEVEVISDYLNIIAADVSLHPSALRSLLLILIPSFIILLKP